MPDTVLALEKMIMNKTYQNPCLCGADGLVVIDNKQKTNYIVYWMIINEMDKNKAGKGNREWWGH